jgi:predicted secreted hydrolase
MASYVDRAAVCGFELNFWQWVALLNGNPGNELSMLVAMVKVAIAQNQRPGRWSP